MKTLYLDQFAISKMANDEPLWADIKILLRELISSGKIKCFTSIETPLETSLREPQMVHKNYELIKEFTGDIYFKNLEDIICMQIATTIKGVEYSFNDYVIFVKHNFEDPAILKNNKDNVLLFKDKHNSINLGQLKNIPFVDNGFNLNIINKLYGDMNFTHRDILHLCNEIAINPIGFAPAYSIFTILCSIISDNLKNHNANDLFDIRRIAIGLTMCDIMICDSVWKHRIITSKELKNHYSTEIISGKKSDLKLFCDKLQQLNQE